MILGDAILLPAIWKIIIPLAKPRPFFGKVYPNQLLPSTGRILTAYLHRAKKSPAGAGLEFTKEKTAKALRFAHPHGHGQ